ncbi:uncharacterized protein PHACADRAFT_132775, partial [Phanerochaete carnosa HHB-10118-sp]
MAATPNLSSEFCSLLRRARKIAKRNTKYSSEATRKQISDGLQALTGKIAHTWQVDTSEAMYLGLDVALVAGTGAGKTWTFMGALLADASKTKKIIIVSPLTELQRDQVKRFKAVGFTAAAVNAATWCPQLRQHQGFSKLMRTPSFTDNVLCIAIDEAHTITLWGGDFRKQFAELERL